MGMTRIVEAAADIPVTIPIWKPPDDGLYKVNGDAAIDVSGLKVGIGIDIRNSVGQVMASSSQSIKATFSPQVAEAIAILRGLQLVIDSGLSPCLIESDAEVVVKWINSEDQFFSDIGNVITNIKGLLIQARCISVKFIPRKANQVAHLLAKNSLSCGEDMFWLEEFSSCIDYVIATECRGCM